MTIFASINPPVDPAEAPCPNGRTHWWYYVGQAGNVLKCKRCGAIKMADR